MAKLPDSLSEPRLPGLRPPTRTGNPLPNWEDIARQPYRSDTMISDASSQTMGGTPPPNFVSPTSTRPNTLGVGAAPSALAPGPAAPPLLLPDPDLYLPHGFQSRLSFVSPTSAPVDGAGAGVVVPATHAPPPPQSLPSLDLTFLNSDFHSLDFASPVPPQVNGLGVGAEARTTAPPLHPDDIPPPPTPSPPAPTHPAALDPTILHGFQFGMFPPIYVYWTNKIENLILHRRQQPDLFVGFTHLSTLDMTTYLARLGRFLELTRGQLTVFSLNCCDLGLRVTVNTPKSRTQMSAGLAFCGLIPVDEGGVSWFTTGHLQVEPELEMGRTAQLGNEGL